MPLNFEIIDPLKFKGWDELISSRPESTIFHSSSWARVLYETFKYQARYLTVLENEKLLALVPIMEINSPITGRRGVSLPFTDICEPIIDSSVSFQDILSSILKLGRESLWETFVLKGGTQYLKDEKSSRRFYTHSLELKRDEGEILRGFRSNTRRNIKKALREGVRVEISDTFESLREFYRLYAITRKRLGTPIQPFAFFKNLHKNIISKGKGIIILASHKNKVIAAGVYTHFKGQAVFQYGASDKRFQALRPNNLVMWEAIKWYARNGFDSFSFGVTDLENIGLRRYKSSMATSEQVLGYYVYNFQKNGFIAGRSLRSSRKKKIFQNSPIIVSKLLGWLLYKHIENYYR